MQLAKNKLGDALCDCVEFYKDNGANGLDDYVRKRLKQSGGRSPPADDNESVSVGGEKMAERTDKTAHYSLWRQQQRLAPYIFVSPFVLLFCVFGVYPIFKSFYLAFHTTNGPRSVVFTGLQNFAFLFADPDFFTAVKNTATFAFYSVLLQLPLSLGMAMLLNSEWVRGRNVFRFIFFSPNLLGQVFVAVLAGIILSPRFGLVPQLVNKLTGAGLDMKLLRRPQLDHDVHRLRSPLAVRRLQLHHTFWPRCSRSIRNSTKPRPSTVRATGSSSGMSRFRRSSR